MPSSGSDGQKLIDLKFFKGELIGINNKVSNPIELINYLEQISSKYAIGRDIHVGDKEIGIKGRVGYEATAAKKLNKCHYLDQTNTKIV